MAPTATLATELPTRAFLFAGSWTWRKTPKGLALVQIAAAIGAILQLLITLGQSEAPPVIVQAPRGARHHGRRPRRSPGGGGHRRRLT